MEIVVSIASFFYLGCGCLLEKKNFLTRYRIYNITEWTSDGKIVGNDQFHKCKSSCDTHKWLILFSVIWKVSFVCTKSAYLQKLKN